jgi:hypothetical protein
MLINFSTWLCVFSKINHYNKIDQSTNFTLEHNNNNLIFYFIDVLKKFELKKKERNNDVKGHMWLLIEWFNPNR